jgi:hypothetical protein
MIIATVLNLLHFRGKNRQVSATCVDLVGGTSPLENDWPGEGRVEQAVSITTYLLCPNFRRWRFCADGCSGATARHPHRTGPVSMITDPAGAHVGHTRWGAHVGHTRWGTHGGAPDHRGGPWLKGDSAFVNSARARFAGTVFVIDARDGGRLRYDPPNSRTDVFPLDDTVTAAASVYVLAGRRTAGMDVTAVTAEVGGTLDLSGADPVVRLTISTAALNATSCQVAAVLPDQGHN